MKKFLFVLVIVLAAIGILAACAPVQQNVEEYARALPGWVIVVGAVIIFLIGFGIIWKLVPGFVKVLAVIALAVILAGSAYGIWQIPAVDDLLNKVDQYKNQTITEQSPDPSSSISPEKSSGLDIDIHIGK